MFNVPLITFSLFTQIFLSTPKTISHQIKIFSSLPYILFSFQTTKNPQKLAINIAINYTWISEWEFNKSFLSKADKVIDTPFTIRKKSYKSSIYENKLLINNDTIIPNFRFYSVRMSPIFLQDTGYGFGCFFIDEQMSIIHQLYQNGYINKKTFFIDFTSISQINKYGMFHMGDIPQKPLSKINYVSKFKAQDNLGKWGNIVKTIYFIDKKYEFNQFAYFQTNGYGLIESKLFVLFFKNTIGNLLKKNACKLVERGLRIKHLYCNDERIKNWPPLIFGFDKVNLTLAIRKLFYIGRDGYCTSNFKYEEDRIFEGIEFGYHFLKMFDIIGFDYHAKEISFYQIEDNKIFPTKRVSLSNNSIIININIILIILYSLNIIFLLIVKFPK